MTGRCGKRRFRDELAAKMALADIWATDASDRPTSEVRAYRCRYCGGGWHLTSQPQRTKPRLSDPTTMKDS